MCREFLERLYWSCSDQNADQPSLCDLYERMEDTSQADALFSKALYASTLTMAEKSHIEGLDCDACVAYEKQGFINGFRLGMKLAGEIRTGGAET